MSDVVCVPEHNTDSFRAEVVLAVMLRSFKFHSTGKDIYWNLAGVSYPSVDKEPSTSEGVLPLKLEPLETKFQ